ncbi:hypothetical protein GCM10022224_087410 [Nonomuraea antimicrobica]|uniref:Uncharacterized protein n=1 Tax=Nonomuraea antimicrobica TaxID=561173 RepID=A0ABP7DS88_9ACTN
MGGGLEGVGALVDDLAAVRETGEALEEVVQFIPRKHDSSSYVEIGKGIMRPIRRPDDVGTVAAHRPEGDGRGGSSGVNPSVRAPSGATDLFITVGDERDEPDLPPATSSET